MGRKGPGTLTCFHSFVPQPDCSDGHQLGNTKGKACRMTCPVTATKLLHLLCRDFNRAFHSCKDLRVGPQPSVRWTQVMAD